MPLTPTELRDRRKASLEAFADTVLPGARRHPGDRAIAGAAEGPGAVEAGALDLLTWDATGMAEGLDELAHLLDEHAREYARAQDIGLDTDVPPFVALPYEHRTALVRGLTSPGHPEKEFWVLLALFSYMAYDSAAHLSTREALAAGHPGLTALGFEQPGEDGLWRFPDFSYGRRLADLHPDTTPSGSPA